METTLKVKTLAHPWEGVTMFLRTKTTRGSASGSALAGEAMHRMAGYNYAMQPVAMCGLVFSTVDYILRRKADIKICKECETQQDLKERIERNPRSMR